MSDREPTLVLLKEHIQSKYGCKVLRANTTQYNLEQHTDLQILEDEHGIYRGVGFYQDWALARHARSGGIAHFRQKRPVLRSSSFLIQSSIEFRRVFEYDTLEDMPKFDICKNRDDNDFYIPFDLEGRKE
eukprot:CAMPEP_0194153464 /NCGR_PEP_ID=MMETSP0152-20130528/56516_1 /TAXON_ID=1049557 /ORGANISM="Thalassiothrix antarctica, Strain L6-D1" /LENGTH=129 /DNA_ID=CAMNT_0038858769 /DNA_START=306 /DNA_END=695 /DNA_ORIENTATION=-